MSKQRPKTHLFTKQDLRTSRSTQTFAACSIWIDEGMDKQIATFDLTVREFINRNYMIFSGLNELIEHIKDFKFSSSDIKYLLEAKIISPKCGEYFRGLKFTGEILSLEEGTPFFPGEPIIRVTAPIIEAALLELTLMNIASSNIPFITKAVRAKIAALDKFQINVALFRAHSFESGIKACRNAYIAGLGSGSTPSFYRKYHITIPTPFTIGQHFFIKSFPCEIDAMRAMARFSPNNSSFMVDTYNFKEGINNAITVAKELEHIGHHLHSIYIDSGDLIKNCAYARKKLKANDLEYVKIFTGSNADEYKIEKYVKEGLDCDLMAFVTEYVTLSDSPKLEVIYKIAQISDGKKTINTAKLSPGKLSLPGKKQIYRTYDKNQKITKDIIALENENLGEPLLKTIYRNGKLVYTMPSLDQSKEYTSAQVQTLPKNLLDLHKRIIAPVEISRNITSILNELKTKHRLVKRHPKRQKI